MTSTSRRPIALAIALLPLLYGASAGLRAQTTAGTLTLGQAVAEALARGQRMLDQLDSVEQAGLGVRAARSAFRPKLVPNVLGSFGQTDVNDQTYRLDLSQRFVTGTEFRMGIGSSTAQIPSTTGEPDIRFYNADTTLMVNQPLLKGFGRAVSRRALTSAEVRYDEANRQRVMAEQQIAVDVAASYFGLVAQLALVDAAGKGFDRARQLREASEAKMNAGLVSQLDVLRAQQLVLQAELQLFEAQGAVEDARDQLRFLIGRDAGTPLDVVAEIPRTVDEMSAADAVTMALDSRLDLQGAAAAAADAERAVSYAGNQLLPQVDVSLALTRRQTADHFGGSFGLDGYQFATFFNISMPVDRTPQSVEYQNALIERDRRRRDIETIRRRIGDDVRRVIRERDRALRNLAGAETNVTIARQEVDVAQFRYERGLSNNLDVVTAETGLLDAESRRILTHADLAVIRLRLRATLGILDPRADTAPPAAQKAAGQ